MKKEIFLCDGPSGKIEFEIAGDVLLIRETGKGEFRIPINSLLRIEYRNHPWMCQNSFCFLLSLVWTIGRSTQKREVLLFHDRKENTDLLQILEARYPNQCLIGPSEQERARLLTDSNKNLYRLYALGFATSLGIISAILIIQIIFIYLSLSTSQFAIVENTDAFYRAGKFLFIIVLVPLTLLMMILLKKVMVVKTDQRGLTLQKIFMRKTLPWEEIEPGIARMETSNIYTGLFCYYSDQVNVLTASSVVEIPLRKRKGDAIVLKMSAGESGRLYRELYYRGKVSLGKARAVKAFP
ncbi:MAG: hypothetical protein NT022_05400 [Deltaproteobacteria bacterium]|nr:hypothetical protein [Deltaproteobacteria bacterium]